MNHQKFDEYRAPVKNSDIYSDFNTSFIPHPNTGQLTRKTNLESIRQALRNLILTNKYERLRNPKYGTNIRRFLFEPHMTTTNLEIKQHIEETINHYEPRVKLNNVIVKSREEDNAIDIAIHFYAIIAEQEASLNLTLYRVR